MTLEEAVSKLHRLTSARLMIRAKPVTRVVVSPEFFADFGVPLFRGLVVKVREGLGYDEFIFEAGG